MPGGPPLLVPRGTGKKVGFCPADERLAGPFTSFFQDPTGKWNRNRTDEDFAAGDPNLIFDYPFGGSCLSPTRPTMGLTPGWGDLYEWVRPEQFVEFGGLGNGEYVVRVTADRDNGILESDESDNVSYAHIRVAGDSVTILERGHGSDPWDPGRQPE